ncbi:MAG: hypothetical protein JWO38_1722 [Gemmataceae bacterium]|nr:hypothetical protein [Gemmataceae bacterium]
MSELRQAVAILAEYVASDNMDVPDAVGQAAGVYALACHKANERLVACDQLLKANQRSEALRQAQLEPDVLKLYADLDFPARDRWEDISQQVGLPVPPRLNAVVARRLNKAFAESQSTEDLLRQHRLLALARAPLQRRLDILRLLARAEPTNLGWADDVRAYEVVRYEEMQQVFADPRRPPTWAVVCRLHEDLSSDVWITPPPLDLLGTVQTLRAKLHRKQGEQLIEAINPQLAKAVSDQDLDAARELESQVEALAIEYGLPESSRALATFNQAGEWIDAELKWRKRARQFDRAVDQLRTALKDGVDWWYVQEFYRVALEFDMPIPRDVTDRFAGRARGRRLARGLAVVAGVVAVLAGVAVYLIKF